MIVPAWPLAIVVAVGILLAAVLFMGPRLFPGTRPWTRAFRCPFLERAVTAEFQESVWDGRRQDVTRCTAFTPPAAVTCAKACLALESLPPPRGDRDLAA